jgi:hypothetical protein
MLRILAASALLAGVLFSSAIARAQAAAPSPSSSPSPPQPMPAAITPPRALTSTGVPYPSGATGDAMVLLELTIEKDGAVSRASVIEGDEPFAEHARVAALAWRFAPARRGEVPVAARIRARVVFRGVEAAPQSSTPSGSPTTSAAPPETAAPAGGASFESIEEVNVRGARREIGQTTLSAPEIREMPGAFGDPFRAIEALPGVSPVVSGLPYFYIRGAPPNDNGFYVDGVRVPLLFHVGVAQGVIHPSLIERVDFFPGAAPARYGGDAGAVIDAETRAPALERHAEVNLRLVDSGALVETPLGDGRGSALVAGRFGYPGFALGLVQSNINLEYSDYQARTTWRVGDRDTIGVFALGSHDLLKTVSSGDGAAIEQFASDFHRVDLRWDHALENGRVRVGVTGGWQSQGASPTYFDDTSTAVRVEIDERASQDVLVRGGAIATLDAYSTRQAPASRDAPLVPSTADPPPTNVRTGAHADVVWRMTPRVEIVPGARFDVYESARGGTSAAVPAFDPRLSARTTISRDVVWVSALGIGHQYPTLRVGQIPAMLVSVPGFVLGADGQAAPPAQLQTAAHASQGIEVALPASFTLTATGFLTGWTGLTDVTAVCFEPMAAASVVPMNSPGQKGDDGTKYIVCPDNAQVQGRAYGVELLLRRALSKRLGGWLSYTLSRSTREAHFITPQGGDAIATVPSEGDRTHILNAILSYEIGAGWRAGARLVFLSGEPYSKMSGNYPIPPYNDQRYPPFFRADVRAEKRWRIDRARSVALVFEVQNATLSKEEYGVSCQGESTPTAGGFLQTTSCRPSTLGPITIPSIGVEAFF